MVMDTTAQQLSSMMQELMQPSRKMSGLLHPKLVAATMKPLAVGYRHVAGT